MGQTPVPRPVQGKMHHRTLDGEPERIQQADRQANGSVLRHGDAHEPVKLVCPRNAVTRCNISALVILYVLTKACN